ANAGRIGTGHYAAGWTVPSNEAIGTHLIRWFFKLTAGSNEQQFSEEFEVLSSASASSDDAYCTVQDIRDEGVPSDVASDALVMRRAILASQLIDRTTGQWFLPRTCTFSLDGKGGPMVLLNIPIISLDTISIAIGGASPP